MDSVTSAVYYDPIGLAQITTLYDGLQSSLLHVSVLLVCILILLFVLGVWTWFYS